MFWSDLPYTYSIYIIAIAGAESAIGLGILVAFYRLRGSVAVSGEFGVTAAENSFRVSPVSSWRGVGKREYSTSCSTTGSLNPWFVTGLIDAEGSFVIVILRDPKFSLGWRVQVRFQLKLHISDTALIESVNIFFGGVGYISNPDKNSVELAL